MRNAAVIRTAGFEPDDDVCWIPLTFADAGLVRIERNFIHHNARDDGGYGVDVSGGSFVTITGNVFNYNRHAVTATGKGHSGYVARFNYVLQGGYREDPNVAYGGSYNQHMDVHGEPAGGYGGAGGNAVRYLAEHVPRRSEIWPVLDAVGVHAARRSGHRHRLPRQCAGPWLAE